MRETPNGCALLRRYPVSGYHMAVVAGAIFFIVRALFALIPGFADRAPIKKWAALAALLVNGFYLILSGNQVATQRSFIMIAVVLLGVLFDRPALTMRTLTIRRSGGAGICSGIDSCIRAFRCHLPQPSL